VQTIAVINQKGGTGKTTTAINLGAALGEAGKKILLIDLDPQSNLSFAFGISGENGSITSILQAKASINDVIQEKEGVQIAPASRDLADLELSLVNKIGRENVLKDKLKGLKGYDYVFIDCPPALSVLTVNALNAADEVLIPLQPEVLSLQGLTQLLDTVKEVRQVLNKGLKVRGIVPSMYKGRRKLSGEIIEQIEKSFKEKVFSTHIRECVRIAEAPSFAKSVISYAPHSNGADDFRALAREFLNGKG